VARRQQARTNAAWHASRSPSPVRSRRAGWPLLAAAVGLMSGGCSATYDVGSTGSHGPLPVDERNPVVIVNDFAFDNWQGEYAMLLSSTGGQKLVGIVVDWNTFGNDVSTNLAAWRVTVTAARASGLKNIPDPIASMATPLVRPSDGNILSTAPNRSDGALFIIEMSKRFSLPGRPLVVATGAALTDIADAYLVDPTVRDRVVVVASLGSTDGSGASMGSPNGDLDPWADVIVAEQFRYVQVSAFYDQTADLPASRVSDLPANPFVAHMAAKRSGLNGWQPASDQVSVLAAGLPKFVTSSERMRVAAGSVGAGSNNGPELTPDPQGSIWVVSGCEGSLPGQRLLDLLSEPKTFGL